MKPSKPDLGAVAAPDYRRAREASAFFGIAPSTLWNWVKTREGFPQPLKAGAKVTLFDVAAIDRYLKSGM